MPHSDEPHHHDAEHRRIAAVRATGLIGVDAGERLDRIARRAASIAGAPMALVSLVDDQLQWSPGLHGDDAPRELPRQASFCSVAIDRSAALVVPDATKDARFAETAGVVGEPHIRFYAGHPIDDGRGNLLGAVCVIDVVPREPGTSDELVRTLGDLAVWARHELIAERAGPQTEEPSPGEEPPAPTDGGPAPATALPADVSNADAAAAADERLQELERLQALVVATTAHELRTPLTVLRVHSDLLSADVASLEPGERASVEAIGAAVARLQVVSDDLVANLRGEADGAEHALRRWLEVEEGADRIRPISRPGERPGPS